MSHKKVKEICKPFSSSILINKMKNNNGDYPLWGAKGLVKNIDTYQQDRPYISIVKWGAGVGRVEIRSEKTSIVATMQGIIPNPDIDIRWLSNALKFLHLENFATKATVPNLYFRDYGEAFIRVPSLTEQKYISDVLEKIEINIEKKRHIINVLDNLIKARFVEMFRGSKSYPVKPLSDIAKYWNGLTYKPTDVSHEGTIVLRSSNIQNMQLNLSDIVRVKCDIGNKKTVKENDILMCSRNGSAKLVGKVALIPNLHEQMSFGAFMMVIRSEYYPYLMTYFQLPEFRSQISTGTTTINQITQYMLDKICLPVPNKASIDRFSSFIAKVDKSKFAVQKSLEKTQQLFDSLMQEYFG